MIRIFWLFSTSLLFLLLSSPAVLMPGHAWGGCCGTTCKPWMCTCRGTYPCLYDPRDSNTAQANSATIAGSSQMDIARDAPAFTATTSDLTESISELTTAGKCFRDKLALSLLGNAQEDLKFVTVHFDEKNMVTFLIDADTVK